MSIATEIARLQQAKADLKASITAKGVPVSNEHIDEYAALVDAIPSGGGGGGTPMGSLFTGATIPLTYNGSTTTFNYKSDNYNIFIEGLDGVSNITNNGTKDVTLIPQTTYETSVLFPFQIRLVNDSEEIVIDDCVYAYYGTGLVSGQVLALACINKPNGVAPIINTHYKFVVDTTLPLFTSETTLWGGINSIMLVAVNLENYTGTSIGSSFMRGCYAFNQPITLPNGITNIDVNFMYNCHAFNQPITLPNGITSIGDYFMLSCYGFNQPITLPNSITSIGSSFMLSCNAFNQPITLPNGITSIGDYFMSNCRAFNQPITLPNGITNIDVNFMYNCYAFNQPITIPSGITSIGDNFMNSCYAFNQPLTLPSGITSISSSFMTNCYSFNQPITLPNSITSIGDYFMRSCNAFSTLIYNATVYPTDTNSLSITIDIKKSSTFGVKVYGTGRTGLMTALPNRTSSPFRYLVDGGS